MGTDNLFHRKRAKSIKDLARKNARRSAYARVLIVCEGKKTEPTYFCELRDHYSINTANIVVTGECGSDPSSILRHAKLEFRKSQREGNPFDKVFCVFDRDSHDKFSNTIDAIHAQKPQDIFTAVTSIPCFEYWILLHFIFTNKPYTCQRGNSAANQVMKELKRYMPDYEKCMPGIFNRLFDQIGQAKAFAVRLEKANERAGTDNPSTLVHQLVDYLQKLPEQNALN